MTYRVVQWTTGNVGRESVKVILDRPDLELVGCYAWSPNKAGRDVGELCGIDPIGVTATNDVDALLALQPDCVVYSSMWPDVEEMARILESGANIVTTASFITGHSYGPEGRQRIVDACHKGGTSIFGSGINPGFANLMAIVSASGCSRIDKVTVREEADATGYDSPETELPVGFGRPIDDPDLPEMTRKATGIFEDCLHLVADALGVELDEVVCEPEYAITTEHVDLGSWEIDAGCVAGIYGSWQGRVGGKTLIELSFRWRKGRTLEPDWPIREGYQITIDGMPTIHTHVKLRPPADFVAESYNDYMVLGMIMTAMPAINAIPRVVAAQPGIVTYADLPLPLPQNVAR